MIITVLWEDARGGQQKGFGPHALLLQCVADDLGVRAKALEERVVGRPLKGNGNVRQKVIAEGKQLARRGIFFAVLDEDKVRSPSLAPGTPAGPCLGPVVKHVRAHLELLALVHVNLRLLVRNTETLLADVGAVTGKPPPDRKDPNTRDAFIGGSGLLDPAGRAKRAALRTRNPSFGRLATCVGQAAGLLPGVSKP